MQDSQSRALQLAKEALHECRQWSRSESQSGNHHSDRTMEALAECLLRKAETVLNETVEEIHFQARVRKDLGARLSQYSCSDDMFTAGVQVTTTPSILNETYSGGQPVRTLFESSDGAERIRLYEDFVTEEECQNVFRTRQIPDTMASKVHDLVTSTAAAPAVGVNPNEIFTELKLETSMDIAATTKETTVTTTETTDCPVQDGAESCSSSSRSRSDSSSIGSGSENTPKKQVLVTTTEENVVARLIVTCLATAETTETKTTTTSGMLYFPKTGTRILPTHLSAVLIQYRSNRNSRPQRQRLEEEVDWYLDQHTVCPVTEEGVTVATLETINSSP